MEYNLYQNNNVNSNNQFTTNVSFNDNKTKENIINKKIKIYFNDHEIITKLIGETTSYYVTYEGKLIKKNEILKIDLI